MEVSFAAGTVALNGYLHRPEGRGPFPAVLWNHGSERDPDAGKELAAFYNAAGYVLFVPHRRGHGSSPGEHFAPALTARSAREPRDRVIRALIEVLEGQLADTVAAARWLADRPFVDARRIAMSGVSHGAVQTLLAAEADAGPRAYVPFAPAAVGWEGNPELHARLRAAVQRAVAPILLLQAENDFSLGPSEVLGDELRRKGPPNQARVYPRYGTTADAGHGEFARRGDDVWGEDVLAFLTRALGAPSVPSTA